jgi:hypothetical protein
MVLVLIAYALRVAESDLFSPVIHPERLIAKLPYLLKRVAHQNPSVVAAAL